MSNQRRVRLLHYTRRIKKPVLRCFEAPAARNTVDSFIDNDYGENADISSHMYHIISPGDNGVEEVEDSAYKKRRRRRRKVSRNNTETFASELPVYEPTPPLPRTAAVPLFPFDGGMEIEMETTDVEPPSDGIEQLQLSPKFAIGNGYDDVVDDVSVAVAEAASRRRRREAMTSLPLQAPIFTRQHIYSRSNMLARENRDFARSPPNKKIKFMDFLSPKHDTSEWGLAMHDKSRDMDMEVFPDWTAEFQAILKRPPEERSMQLRELIDHFVATAKRFGRTIIHERSLAHELKTVKPLPGKGFAGGEKFKIANIFFKFAVDHYNLYPNDQCAMKVAGHELKGLTAIVSCGMVLGLSFPLLALIDYRGFRLVATSVLPISEKTIVYGSCDGGVIVHNDVAEMNLLMKRIAMILNLKGHMTGIGEKKKFIYGPCDIEGHQASDGKHYVIDTSRIWPCEKPDTNVKACFMFRLLRGEFVSRYPVPLSSDAFSMFGRHDAGRHNHEVGEATQHLLERSVPDFARALNAEALAGATKTTTPHQLVEKLHRAGINIRHLGRVRSHVTPTAVRELILREICARYLKNVLRKEMRRITSDDEETFRRMTVDFFNLIFGANKGSRVYWMILKHGANAQYAQCLTEQERARTTDLRHFVDLPLLFQRLQDLTGVVFRSSAEPLRRPLELSDYVQMEVKEKHMYAVPRIEADSLAAIARAKDGREALELYSLSRARYQAALELKPDDSGVLQNLGTVTADIARLKFTVDADFEACVKLYAEAYAHFECSLRIHNNDHNVLNRWGNALCEHGKILASVEQLDTAALQFSEAGEKYRQASRICPRDPSVLYNWANQLRTRAKVYQRMPELAHRAEEDLLEALVKYKACTLVREDDTPLTVDAHINWGCALVRLGELKEDAHYFGHARNQFLKASTLVKYGGVLKDEKAVATILALAESNLKFLSTKSVRSAPTLPVLFPPPASFDDEQMQFDT